MREAGRLGAPSHNPARGRLTLLRGGGPHPDFPLGGGSARSLVRCGGLPRALRGEVHGEPRHLRQEVVPVALGPLALLGPHPLLGLWVSHTRQQQAAKTEVGFCQGEAQRREATWPEFE